MRPISISPERDVFRNDWLRVYAVKADFGAFSKEYFVTERNGGRVGTIVLRGDDVLLVRQFRLLINDLSWELPGGGMRVGETAEQAAMRECREEAGVLCRSLRKVFEYQQGIDVTLSLATIFECRDFSMSEDFQPNPETDDRAWVPFGRCIEMMLDGTIRDSMTMLALLMYAHLESRT